MNMLWSPNPRKRRRKLSAAQRAAGFGGKRKRSKSPRRARRSGARRFKQAGFVAMPAVSRRSRRRARVAVRRAGRRARRAFGNFARGNVMNLLRAGAVGGAGAVLVDVAMGQVAPFLPAQLATPKGADGSVNYGYFATKAALALGLGIYGNRLPVIGKYAGGMAEGALTLLAYQFMRPMVPATLNLGAYFNPRATTTQTVRGVAAYQTPRIAVRAGASNGGAGGRAAGVLSMVNTMRRPA